MGRGDFAVIEPGQIRMLLQQWNADHDGPVGQVNDVDGDGMVNLTASYVLLNPTVNSTPMGPGFSPNIGYNLSTPPDPTVADFDNLSLELEWQADPSCGDRHACSYDFIRGCPISFNARQYALYVSYPRNPLVAIETQPPIRAFASLGRGVSKGQVSPRKTLIFGDVGAGVVAAPQRIPRFASFVYFENPSLTTIDAPVIFRMGSNGPDIHASNVGKRMEGATLVPNGAQYVTIDNTAGLVAIAGARLVFPLTLQ